MPQRPAVSGGCGVKSSDIVSAVTPEICDLGAAVDRAGSPSVCAVVILTATSEGDMSLTSNASIENTRKMVDAASAKFGELVSNGQGEDTRIPLGTSRQ